jgi:branched-subunit amino acid transport protein AzlD
MKTSVGEALILCFVMAVVIFFCRIFPFLFFYKKNGNIRNEGGSQDGHGDTAEHNAARDRAGVFLAFVEKTAPPVAMTVLAFNALPIKSSPREIIPAMAAAVLTALVHLWKRNALLSICGGTVLYMFLIRLWS